MDPQEPNVPEVQPEFSQSTNSPVNKSTSNPNGITIASMALFVLMSLGVIVFLYYQNQQLKNMLAGYQTPVASPTPVATTDPTANWKTYIDSKKTFSFQYPDTSIIKSDSLSVDGSIEFNNFVLFREKSNQLLSDYVSKLNDSNLSPTTITKTVGTLSTIEWIGSYKNAPTHYVSFKNEGYIYNLGLTPLDESNGINAQNRVFFDQILSTFKFISASPSSVPKTTPVSTSSGIPVGY
ncbi:MAG TPA: hypothetical protein VKC53_03640 [Patescibacteria group bacterium]|nr:hypothetical protein [Patescibacteria group bacterium]